MRRHRPRPPSAASTGSGDRETATPLTRRSILLGGAALAATAATRCLPDVDGRWQSEQQASCNEEAPAITSGDPAQAGRVLEIHDPSLAEGGKVSPAAAAEDLRRLLLALTGQPDLHAAWGALIPTYQPGQIVGIKVNTLNPQVPTRPEVVRALVDSLKTGLGLPAEAILVWDRRMDELKRARLTAETLGASVEGTWEAAGEKGSGRGYEVSPICLGGRQTHLSNILTRRIDHLINLAVLKRHDASGFTGCLKNHYGTIDNPGDFHDELGDGGVLLEARFVKAIPGLNVLQEVASKTRLWLLDASLVVCKGGTESPADTLGNRLLGGLDPLALDVRGRQLRDELRGSVGPDPETISEGWLVAAERLGLGRRAIKVQTVT